MTANLEVERKTENRSFSKIIDDAYCAGEENLNKDGRTPLDSCEGGVITISKKGVCPNGDEKILSSKTEVVQPTQTPMWGVPGFPQQNVPTNIKYTCAGYYDPNSYSHKYKLINSYGQVISSGLSSYNCEEMKEDLSN